MLHAFYAKRVLAGCFIIFCFLLVSCFSQTAGIGSDDIKVSSPGGELTLSFHLKNGIPFYSLRKNNIILINNSRLGLRFMGDNTLDKNFKLLSLQISDTISANKSTTDVVSNIKNKVLKVVLQDKAKSYRQLVLIFKLEDKKLSFLYQVPLQSTGHKLVLVDELTEFSLTNNYDIISLEQEESNREKLIGSSKISGLTDPIKMPLNLSYGDSLYVNISESSQSRLQRLALVNNGNNTLKINVSNREGEGYLRYDGLSQLITSSWRVIEFSDKRLSL